MSTSPFTVPEFDRSPLPREHTYAWWSWHPLYPRWSRSCWSESSMEEALLLREEPAVAKLNYYHNKLVHETETSFTVVADDPCRRLDVWEEIKRKLNK